MAGRLTAFARRPEATRDTTIGTIGWRRRHRGGQHSPRMPSLVLDALVESNWRQTWTS